MSNADERTVSQPSADRDVVQGPADPGLLAPNHDNPENQPWARRPPGWQDRLGLATVAGCLLIAATAWYLLKEFAPLLRPLLLAVFLCYIILPTHRRLAERIPPMASLVVLAALSVGLLLLLGWHILGSATELGRDMPFLMDRAQAIIHDAQRYYTEHLPPWLAREAAEVSRGQTQMADRLQAAAGALAGAAAGTLTEAVLVGIYLIFLLVEAGRLPRRIESAFRGQQPDQILAVVGNI